MIPNKFRRQYIHYEMDREAIFNHDVWEFEYITSAKEWQFDNNVLYVRLLTSLNKNAFMSVSFLNHDLLQVRFYRNKFIKNPFNIVNEPEPCDHRFAAAEKEGIIYIQTNALIFKFHLQTCVVEILDHQLKLISQYALTEKEQLFFPEYTLGRQENSDKEIRCFMNLQLQPEEAIYGLGEKFAPINQRGYKDTGWNSDTTGCRWDRAYKNVPFFMSSRGYGVFVHQTERIDYEIGSRNFNVCSIAVESDQLEYFFFYGPGLKKVISTYTKLTGRAPNLPKWSFGFWMSRFSYMNWNQVFEAVEGLRTRNIPVDVVHIDPFWMREDCYCDLVWDPDTFPEPEENLKKLKDMGVRVCLWEQPYIPVQTERFREAEQNGYLVKNLSGKTYIITDFEDRPVGIVDFTNPNAVRWYKDLHIKLLIQGVSVFKTDMGEALPKDAVLANGKTGKEIHNIYSQLYNKAVYEACSEYSEQDALVWGRSGFAGSQKYPLNWSGDPHSTFQDIANVLRGGLSYGLAGVPFWSHDIGGFQGEKPSPELYIRWAQFGLLCSHARAHGCQPREPWEYGEEAVQIFNKFCQLRYRLLPYIWSVANEACNTGLPVIRPMMLEFQKDVNTKNLDLQYMLGPSVLVAPVFNESGWVQVYLPEGEWLDFWTNQIVNGSQWLELKVPLDRIPIYIRQNSVIPTGPEMNFVGEKRISPLSLDLFRIDNFDWIIDADNKSHLHIERDEKSMLLQLADFEGDLVCRFHYLDKPKDVRITPVDHFEAASVAKSHWEYNVNKKLLAVKASGVQLGVYIEIRF